MLFKNDTPTRVKVAIGKGYVCEPGQTIEVEEAYAMPRRHDNGSRRPSVIEQLAPQLKPASAAERLDWEQVPAARSRRTPGRIPSVDELVQSNVPRGVALEMVKQMHAAALEAVTAEASEVEAPAPKKGKAAT